MRITNGFKALRIQLKQLLLWSIWHFLCSLIGIDEKITIHVE